MRVWSAVSMTLGVAIALSASRNARADDVPESEDPARWLKELDLEAGSAEADLRLRELDLRDGVRVRLPPYYLRADRIHLSLGTWGVRVKGQGLLTFCPCDSPPVAVGFSGGWAGPPDEMIVENPTLRVLGVPIFWLPYLWLRSPRKIGLTTPDVSLRGPDGLFLGQGLHVPFGRGLELGAGVYTRGGLAMTADLATERTSTLVRFDFRRRSDVAAEVPSGAGLAVDARGNLGSQARSLTWDVDAIRGARGVRTTLELEALARPYDHADAIARVGPIAVGVTAIDARGAPIDSAAFTRPWVGLLGAVPLGTLGGSNGSIVFGPRWVRGRTDTIGDASLAATIGGPAGVSILSLAARADGRVAKAGDGELPGDRASALVGELRGEASIPLARPIGIYRAAGGPPVLHVIEPLLQATAIGARAGGDRNALAGFVSAPAFAEDTTARLAFLTAIGARTSLGSLSGGIAPGRDPWIGKLAAQLAIGALQIDSPRDAPLAGDIRWAARRADGGSTLIALQGATARALNERRGIGWLLAGRTRWEYSREGFGAELRGAARDQLSVLAGWALLGAELAPRLTTATGLAAPGTTVGVGTAFPIGLGVRLGGDVDVYGATARALFESGGARLLDVRGTIRYRHPCGCFRLAVRGGHVIGREGIDVFGTFELAKTDPNDPRDF